MIKDLYFQQEINRINYLLKGRLDEGNIGRVTLDKVSEFKDDRDFTFSPAGQSSDAAGQWYQYTLDIGALKNTFTRGDGSVGTDTATIKFYGTRAAIIGGQASDGGKFDVTVDGITETIDTYSATLQDKVELWSNDSLTPGEHTLTITLRADKNASSSNYYLYLDGLRIGPGMTLTQLGMGYVGVTYTVTTDGSGNADVDGGLIAPAGYSAICLIGVEFAVAPAAYVPLYQTGRYVRIRGAAAGTTYYLNLYAAVMPL